MFSLCVEEIKVNMEEKPKVIVIRLDGATRDLIKPWADEEKLPTFRKLMEEGAEEMLSGNALKWAKWFSRDKFDKEFERVLMEVKGVKPLVSVVIPTFNSEKYVEKCLQSVRNQTYDNIEIIVVDKNSKDRTVEIAEKYRDKFNIDMYFTELPEMLDSIHIDIVDNFGNDNGKLKPMQIIAINNGIAIYENMSGGDKFIIELCKQWSNDGHSVHYVTSTAGRDVCVREGLNCTFHALNSPGVDKIGLVLDYVIRTIMSLFLNIPDSKIVVSASCFIYDSLPAFIIKLRQPQSEWIATKWHMVQGITKRSYNKNITRNLLAFISQWVSLKLLKKKADIILTENSEVKNALTKFGIPPNKIKIVGVGLDLGNVNKISDQKKVYDACFLARIDPKKGFLDLVEIWKKVCEMKDDAKLAIIGGGEKKYTDALKKKIRKTGLKENIKVLGYLSEEEKYKTLKSSKIFVFTSYEEGIPLVFMEAMACGLPVITYYLPTYKELGDMIIKVPLGEVQKMAETILKLLEKERLRDEYGNTGKAFVKGHDWSVIANYVLNSAIGSDLE